jgi:hypothetical protein
VDRLRAEQERAHALAHGSVNGVGHSWHSVKPLSADQLTCGVTRYG